MLVLRHQGESGLGLREQKATVIKFSQQNRGNSEREYLEVESRRNSDRQQLAHALSHAKRAKATFVVAKLAQQLAQHSTITLTMDRYSHLGLIDMTAGLESLSTIAAPEATTMRATGTTDDAPDLSCTKSCNASVQLNRFQPLSTEVMATAAATSQKRKTPQIPAENEGFEGVKAVGLEPTTYGLKVRCSTN